MSAAAGRLAKNGCRVGMVTSAAVNNFPPLLFSTFQSEFSLSVGSAAFLASLNFLTQTAGALLANVPARLFGLRASMSGAHFIVFAGLAALAFFPSRFLSPPAGISAAIALCGLGAGAINVLANPIVEAVSGDRAALERSSIYSFYCWGFAAVALGTTTFFAFFGAGSWKTAALSWSVVPLLGCVIFAAAPISPRVSETPAGFAATIREKSFPLFLLLMFCAGAAEQSMAQWASLFAEKGLGVRKALGDVAGPSFFAALMGVSRYLHSRRGKESDLGKCLSRSALAAAAAYGLAAFAPLRTLSFLGCGLIGLFAGILWPGTLGLAAKNFPGGGAPMFAALVLAGNVGCAAGPAAVGLASAALGSAKTGIIAGAVFALVFAAAPVIGGRKKTWGPGPRAGKPAGRSGPRR
ncbi:MAG: MFS transporter [Deltaproteobacteria bacterium]|nr:MFS transporter [Deltaproteobacteria bacterium]